MNYSDKHKILWATPFRTATRSCTPIQKYFDFDVYGYHNLEIPKDKLDFLFVCNTKNPYSRMVSIYNLYCFHNNISSDDFDDWIRPTLHHDSKNPTKSNYQTFLLPCFKKKPDLIIKVENLYPDILKIPLFSDNSDELFDIVNKNILNNSYLNEFENKKHWSEYYNQDLADFVYSYLEQDFVFFNYLKDSWKNGTS